MRWDELLFAHWPVDPNRLAPLLPEPLELDTADGVAWLAVVPFSMTITPRGAGILGRWLHFPELNVRTYVRGERPGVYFFSLDAAHATSVRVARRLFDLPYYDARMHAARTAEGWVEYRSTRTHRGAPAAALDVRYRPIGRTAVSRPGSLAHFLTERYCFYTADAIGRVRRVDIAHEPWPLQPADWDVGVCDMTAQLGIALPDGAPLLHYAERVAVRAWLPVKG